MNFMSYSSGPLSDVVRPMCQSGIGFTFNLGCTEAQHKSQVEDVAAEALSGIGITVTAGQRCRGTGVDELAAVEELR